MKTAIKYSFLARILTVEQVNLNFLNNSLIVRYFLSLLVKGKLRLRHYFAESSTGDLLKTVKDYMCYSFTKSAGILILSAVSVNLVLSLILKKQLSMVAWSIRVLFFIIAVCFLSKGIDWPTLKHNSIFLKGLRRKDAAH